MDRARSRDAAGVADVIYDMVAAGLSPGPRSFHGLIVSHTLNGDVEGAVVSRLIFLSGILYFVDSALLQLVTLLVS